MMWTARCWALRLLMTVWYLRPKYGRARCGCAFAFGKPTGRCPRHGLKISRIPPFDAAIVADPWEPGRKVVRPMNERKTRGGIRWID
jgi:hypothetical protein